MFEITFLFSLGQLDYKKIYSALWILSMSTIILVRIGLFYKLRRKLIVRFVLRSCG